jgi:hypothetical protein
MPDGAAPAATCVLVLWVGHRPGPWTCSSLERQGYRVLRAHPADATGGRSPAGARPLRYPSPTDAPEAFLDFVVRTCADRGVDVVLPLDEDIVRLLAERAPDLGGAAVAGPDAAQYLALCDKARLPESARRAGVDHPYTLEIAGELPADGWPELPCIVKPSISGSSGLWEKPTLTATAQERDAAVRELVAAGVPALVQERLTGPRYVGHCVLSDHAFDFLGFRVDRDYPRGAGPASVMHTAAVPAAVIDATRRLLDLVGYRGPCSLSFIERDGRFLVHDVNLRLGATVEGSIRAGFDLPARSVEAALGRPCPPLPPLAPTRYVRFDGELRELVRALRRRAGGESALTLARWIGAGFISRRTVLDPSPFDPSWALGLLSRKAQHLGSRLAARAGRAG